MSQSLSLMFWCVLPTFHTQTTNIECLRFYVLALNPWTIEPMIVLPNSAPVFHTFKTKFREEKYCFNGLTSSPFPPPFPPHLFPSMLETLPRAPTSHTDVPPPSYMPAQLLSSFSACAPFLSPCWLRLCSALSGTRASLLMWPEQSANYGLLLGKEKILEAAPQRSELERTGRVPRYRSPRWNLQLHLEQLFPWAEPMFQHHGHPEIQRWALTVLNRPQSSNSRLNICLGSRTPGLS